MNIEIIHPEDENLQWYKDQLKLIDDSYDVNEIAKIKQETEKVSVQIRSQQEAAMLAIEIGANTMIAQHSHKFPQN